MVPNSRGWLAAQCQPRVVGWLAAFLIASCSAPGADFGRISPSAPTPPTAQRVPATLPNATGIPSPTVPHNPASQQVLPSPPLPTGVAAASPFPITPEATCREAHGQVSARAFDSTALARRINYQLYLPPCYADEPARRFPVLYLLHGANADDTQWLDLNVATDADQLIAERKIAPLLIVLPDSGYVSGEDYAAFVRSDLIPEIEHTTRAASTRDRRAIGGISLGGYWALRLALAHPELVSAVGGHSPATNAALLPPPSTVPAWQGLRVYLDVGDGDPLTPGVSEFVSDLGRAGLAPVFHQYPGGHNRPYWRSHTAEYLQFYSAGW